MKFHFILLAGGSGERMGGGLPKQYRELNGRPVFLLSLDVFLKWPRGGRVVVVARRDYLDRTEELIAGFIPGEVRREKSCKVVVGGDTRHGSELNGLRAMRELVGESDVFFLHDAARPYLEKEELDRLADCFLNCPDCRLASLAAPITDTVVRGAAEKKSGSVILQQRLERSELFAVKTPQALRGELFRKLETIPEDNSFTDLLSWGQAAGIPGYLVESGPYNHKLTTPQDYELLRYLFSRE